MTIKTVLVRAVRFVNNQVELDLDDTTVVDPGIETPPNPTDLTANEVEAIASVRTLYIAIQKFVVTNPDTSKGFPHNYTPMIAQFGDLLNTLTGDWDALDIKAKANALLREF